MAVRIHRLEGIEGASNDDFSAYQVLVLEPAVGAARLIGTMLTQDIKVGVFKRVTTLSEAVKTLSAGSFNVMIADWSRQTDTLKLLSALRSEKSINRYLPVIVVTNNSGAKNSRTLRDAGADEVVHKPFTLRILRSRLKVIGLPGRPFVVSNNFFGPDRRRYRSVFEGIDQREHANCRNSDRRHNTGKVPGRERRQGWPGFTPLNRRSSYVRAKILELEGICEGLNVPQVLALRRITLADPQFRDRHCATDLDDFFTIQLLSRIEDYSYEKLEEMAPDGFSPLLPPGSEAEVTKDRETIFHLTRHLFG